MAGSAVKMCSASRRTSGDHLPPGDRLEGERRVQYFLFIKVIDAETSDILFQNKSQVTKALVD